MMSTGKMIAPYITRKEYECKRCGELPPMFDGDIPDVYLQLFDDFSVIRGRWGKLINISSGYRCPKHNKAIGGVLLSAHCFGLALDLDLDTVADVQRLEEIIEDVAPDLRRGKYTDSGTFIHIDNAFEIYPRCSKHWVQGARWYG